jgi:acetyltransferase
MCVGGGGGAARLKPVIVIKAGRHAEGARAAASHTGALAGSDIVYDAAFRRAGILRVHDLEALFAAAETLSRGVRLAGERLAIVTNGGGIGVLATDRLIDEGGVLAELSPETIGRLNDVLPPTWPKANPVDIIGDAPGARYRAAVEALFDDPAVGAMLVMNCPTAIADPLDAAVAVTEAVSAARTTGRRPPVFATWLGSRNTPRTEAAFTAAGIPTYSSPERAVEAFMYLVRHDRAQAQLQKVPAAEDEGPSRFGDGRPTIADALAAGRQWLTPAETRRMLAAFGIPTVRGTQASTPDDAVRAAASLGWPVALKIQSQDIVHKSDVGGVVLDIAAPEALRKAAEAMLASVRTARPDARIDGFSVETMAGTKDAFELIVGMTDDPTFGPVLMFGAGGTAVELNPDRAIGLLPMDQALASALVEETRIGRLLRGFRGRAGVDLRALAGILVRVSDLVIGVPEILELDINPLLARPDGFVALDARMRIGPADSRRPLSIRPYPQRLEAVETLPDGTRIQIRPVRPTDQSALCRLVERLDPEDRRLRFLSALQRLPPSLAARLSQIDYDREMALIATADAASHEILGVVRLMADPDNRTAEYAVLVRSDLKGHGLGWCLMNRIIAYARGRGLQELTGKVLAENAIMLRMAAELGFTLKRSRDDPTIVDVTLKLGAA